MQPDLAHIIPVLERTPATLRAMLGGLSSAWTDPNEGPGSWSPRDVVGHLIHGERTDWIPRARIILAQGKNRRFAPFDREAMLRDDAGASLEGLLDEFARLRLENLAILQAWHLVPAQLSLTGEHPEFGSVTLAQLLATWVTHDLSHIAQVARVMARQQRDAVGPWRAYLPILDR